MKQFTWTLLVLLMALPAFLAVLLLGDRDLKQSCLQRSLDLAMEQGLRAAYMRDYRPIEDAEALLNDIRDNVSAQLDGRGELSYTVYGLDFENGYLDLEVSWRTPLPWGLSRTLRARRTLLVEDWSWAE